MTELTRRNLFATSAAALAASYGAKNVAAADKREVEWAAVQILLTYRKSQELQLKPIMEELLNVFTRRVLLPQDDAKSPGVGRGMVCIELLDDKVMPHFWTFIHDESGSILLATGAEQLKVALRHLKSIARKRQARGVFYSPGYPQGVPPVIELPKGVTTSLPVHHVA